jgi:ATP-dependent DNA helicase RecG
MALPPLSVETRILSLPGHGIPRLGKIGAEKLAAALSAHHGLRDPASATVEHLLTYIPMRYEDRSRLTSISELYDGLEASVQLTVKVAGGFHAGNQREGRRAPLYIFEITGNDPKQSGRPVVVWWWVSGRNAQPILKYQRDRFPRGATFVAYGKWEWDVRRSTFALRLSKPDELELISSGKKGAIDDDESVEAAPKDEISDDHAGERNAKLDAIHVGHPVPVYRKLGDFATKRLREVVYSVLDQLTEAGCPETLPATLLKRRMLLPRLDAYRRVHFPSPDDKLAEYDSFRAPAQVRLIYEEFFWLSLAIAVRRSHRVKEEKGAKIRVTEAIRKRLAARLPFSLTGAQSRAVERIFDDMQSDAPMNLLLQGDVGSGKTIVAAQAMLAAVANGYQAAIMAPTEILAEQHARTLKELLKDSGVRVELLTGSVRAAEKRRLQADLAAGDIHLAVGTHALIQDAVAFKRLGLAVIDEQHRFGVMQRAELRGRGYNPDVLVMTATPIPRSLAMTVYGDLDAVVIDELPPGRNPIKTVVVGEDKRAGVYKGIERELKLGRQAYVIYPLVEESAKMDLKDATRMFQQLRDQIFSGYEVGLVHGRMKPAEKDEVMRRFIAREIQVLVATTVVEVGVDVPNSSVMVVEHAERFGLSQLHQLRGRVGRGAEQSYCVLLTSDKQTELARKRLGIMERTNDGFKIAEMDMELRGPGELMGTRQSGLPAFAIGNIVRDMELLDWAKHDADGYVFETKRSKETTEMIKRVRSDPRYGLAKIG